MLKIEINEIDGKVSNKHIISKSTGEALIFREQVAYIYNGGVYPEKFVIKLGKDDSPYSSGFYTLDNSSYSVGDYGSLGIKNIKLISIK